MEKAKKAMTNFLSLDGKHKTSVDEDVRTAITEEHIRPRQHEMVTTAVDKEVHQDHHQTVVQPIKADETLPEKHTYNTLPVENKTFEHGSDGDLQTADNEASKFRNTTTTHDTTHSTSEEPAITREHTHHHVHNHIQPVIQKETIQPHVVHTTVPIHETHHAAPIYHETTVLPPKSMDEFAASGHGKLSGDRTPRGLGEYEGCPEPKDESLRSDHRAQEAIHGR